MKLSVTYTACDDFDFIGFLKTAKESAVDSIECNAFDNEYLSLISTPEEISMFHSLIKGSGIELSCINTDITLIHDDVAVLQEDIIKLKAYIELAEKINCGAVGVKLGSYLPNVNRYKINKNVIFILNAITEICESANIDIFILTDANTCKGETLYPIFKEVNSKHIGLVWDTNETYKSGESFEKTYKLVGKHIKLVHITDRKNSSDNAEFCEIGKGILQVNDLVSYLLSTGFDGALSLKWQKTSNAKSIDFTAQLASFIEFMRDIEIPEAK